MLGRIQKSSVKKPDTQPAEAKPVAAPKAPAISKSTAPKSKQVSDDRPNSVSRKTASAATAKPQPKEGRNLVILGVAATVIALLTTSISLYIYHASGDIYLDRSRPGFLPDESETEELEAQTNNYHFPDSGPIDQKTLEEYLNRLKDYQKDLADLPDPYPESSLSDRALGIPEEEPAKGDDEAHDDENHGEEAQEN